MKQITIYDDADYGITVELGGYSCPCRDKADVVQAINDNFWRLQETSCDERELCATK